MSIYNNTNTSDKSSDLKYYVYQYIRENGTPYYIGKGCGKRSHAPHRVPLPKDLSRIQLIQEHLSNAEAKQLEIELIAKYGRKDLGTGILLNMTHGGDGGDTSNSPKYKLGIARRDYTGEKNPNFGKSRSEKAIALIKQNQPSTAGANNGRAKLWLITSPSGEEFRINGTLKEFCIKNNLSYSGMTTICQTGLLSTKGKNVGWSITRLYSECL